MKYIFLKLFGILTSFGMLIVLIQGALVTQTGSGDACGAEWPLCYGELIPSNPTIPTLIEYTHRLVSGVLGIMVIALAIWSWVRLKQIKESRFFAVIAVVFIIFQGLLGAAAVVWGQSDAVMALHFGFSLVSFASVVLLTVLAFEADKDMSEVVPNMTGGLRKSIYFVLVYIYIVVYSGAFVRHTGSSGACEGWPLCNGQLIPSLTDGVLIQFGHRILAGLLFIIILLLFIRIHKELRHFKAFYWTAFTALLFITTQVISGAIVIFTTFNLYATMFHAFMISLLFTTISYLTLLAYRGRTIK
ncbi:COX15/CtaA family protein [Salisediminibacterium beveridgei]|uniref:Heme A synthase n=1 Tax=Salisediminibacterium beveridgei TaxID=632773 RepID=A0A1D7QWB4_9BACI|nr:heme A synthase [Salisediminibacterium beveridgei]AOM83303.1 Heme A synthase, cytochrome oxidase biogenesis protein Cox15-CtaA [Salisediminibacterium beveridgei]